MRGYELAKEALGFDVLVSSMIEPIVSIQTKPTASVQTVSAETNKPTIDP